MEPLLNSWDPVWEKVFSSQAWGKYPGEDLIRFVASNFYKAPQRNEIKILEVGCGPGAGLWYMAREGFKVYGVEGSPSAVQLANDRLSLEVPNWEGEVIHGDISHLNYSDGFFDAVVDNEAIYANTLENSKRIIFEISRVLKQGGKFFSRTFASGSYGDGTGTPAGHNAWICNEGPLKDKGLSRFTTYDEIPSLLKPLTVQSIEMITRTVGGSNSGKLVKEWVICAQK